ncbi:HNH endonuclease [Bradyrhizobium sp. SZCCHNR1020]|uniref:HNH endonuclease n=1 Tax=Bradyrhizobium sp. SZCCHNR1020 TaxID=3057343 RepID=UPI00291623EC|nr:HNH endonuclease [Bradyrhizobium sp. SZCCHNR1020]
MTVAIRQLDRPAAIDLDLAATPWRRILLSAREDIWCLVDAEDYDWLSANTWNVWHGGARCRWKVYAKRNVGWDRATLRMHREIMIRSHHVDHINGNGLDNRRANLRWVTAKQNAANRFVRSAIPSIDDILRELLATLPEPRELMDVPF